MGFFSDSFSSVRSLAGGFGFTPAPAVAAGTEAPPGHMKEEVVRSPEAQALFNVKKNILEQVRTGMPDGERPTLEHYRLACEAHAATEHGQAMTERGEWNTKVHADLSGHDLSGFTITEPKKALAQNHYLDAAPEPETKEQKHGQKIESGIDLHDRDGDGQINVAATHEFYDNIRFDKADLHGAWVEPATSFNEEIAKASNLKDLTFSGMHEGDEFTFGAGKYENATLRDVQGGKVIFGENTQVNGVVLEGKSCHIEMKDHSYISNIEPAEGFRIIDLQMGSNATLAHSDLGESTISMSSHFEPGATFQSVNFGRNVEGIDLSGLKLVNCSIDGKPISHASQLTEYGITHDARTVAAASPETIRNYELATIRETMQNAVASIGTRSASPEAGAPATEIAATRPAASTIIYSGEASHDEIAINTKVASMERTVPVAGQASGANMQRSGGSQS